MKAIPGRTVGINKTSKPIDGAVVLTKDTNYQQLIAGNNVIIYTDSKINEHTIFKIGIAMQVYGAESAVIRGGDWGWQLRIESIT